ncbi:hypothetical protein CIB84_008356 [Bambusicola thoracicus]|uniref:Uncharacterized protein n=1 Tax=Bambusicola thoracicus TaxID=9083 RepID=A0A2P4SUV1_BAMTH|nr:hypothetical protein CIB84_008356 [Bambusicola thoracicus]
MFGSSSQQAARDPTTPCSAQRDAMGMGHPSCNVKGQSLRIHGMVLGKGGNGKPP